MNPPRRNVLTTPLSKSRTFHGLEIEQSINPGLALLWLHSRTTGGTLHTFLTADELTAIIDRATEIRDWLTATAADRRRDRRASRAAQMAADTAERMEGVRE